MNKRQKKVVITACFPYNRRRIIRLLQYVADLVSSIVHNSHSNKTPFLKRYPLSVFPMDSNRESAPY